MHIHVFMSLVSSNVIFFNVSFSISLIPQQTKKSSDTVCSLFALPDISVTQIICFRYSSELQESECDASGISPFYFLYVTVSD